MLVSSESDSHTGSSLSESQCCILLQGDPGDPMTTKNLVLTNHTTASHMTAHSLVHVSMRGAYLMLSSIIMSLGAFDINIRYEKNLCGVSCL